MTSNTRQDGAATVLVLAVAGAVLAAGGVASAAAAAVVIRHHATVAADAAALGAAVAAAEGDGAACARAGELARVNGARLLSCTMRDAVATVTVTVAVSGWLGWLPSVRLNARAGPAETYREEPAPVDGPS